MADGCILVFCGIPASGKTTLAKELISKEWRLAGKCVHFIYVNYDDFIPENLASDNMSFVTKWKDSRKDILGSVEQLLSPRNHDSVDDKSFNGIETFVSQWCSCGPNDFRRLKGSTNFHVMVIDDNMYYRSMRYEYYQLARKISYSFVEIYLHCPLATALNRNVQRTTAVKSATITKMFERLERPEPETFAWEKFFVEIDTSTCGIDDIWEDISSLLEKASVLPAPPIKVLDAQKKAKDQEITEKSIVHRADQAVRKIISQKMEEMKAGRVSTTELRREAESLNHYRKIFMDCIRKEPKEVMLNIFREKYTLRYDEQSGDVNEMKQNASKQRSSHTSEHLEALRSEDYLLKSSISWENFWDVVSVEEFSVSMQSVFERMKTAE